MSRPHPGTERSLDAPVLRFKLDEELDRLKGESDWVGGKRTITLAKLGGLRVVLIALRPGATLDEHVAAGAVTIQVLDGNVDVSVGGEARRLGAGELLAMEPALPHAVRAEGAAAFLLTLAQPEVDGPAGPREK
jgi:quercetin dioxygenase-like cupin family protein